MIHVSREKVLGNHSVRAFQPWEWSPRPHVKMLGILGHTGTPSTGEARPGGILRLTTASPAYVMRSTWGRDPASKGLHRVPEDHSQGWRSLSTLVHMHLCTRWRKLLTHKGELWNPGYVDTSEQNANWKTMGGNQYQLSTTIKPKPRPLSYSRWSFGATVWTS